MTVNFIFILTYMFETIVDICLMRSLVGKNGAYYYHQNFYLFLFVQC